MTEIKKKIIKIFDILTITSAIIICIVTYIVDGLAVLKQQELDIDYSVISATLLLSIAIHFILSAFIQDDMNKTQIALKNNIEQSTKTIINSLNGVEVEFFEDINKVDIYISEKIADASSCVYDFNWQDYMETNPYHRNPIEKKYASTQIDKSIKSFCSKKSSKPKMYKEIFTFSYPKNLGKMIEHLTYGDNYSCSFYDNKEPNTKFPKLQFVIIDDCEVIFVSSAYKPNLCSIKNKRIVSIFCSYFEQAWELSQIIKEGPNINESLVKDIKQKYS